MSCFCFKNIIQIVKNKLFSQTFQTEKDCIILHYNNYQHYYEEQRLNTTVNFIVAITFILLQVLIPSEYAKVLEFN